MARRVTQVGLAVLALLAAMIAVAVVNARPSHALLAPDGSEATRAGTCHVGDREYFGLEGFRVHGGSPVRFTKVTFVSVPANLSVLSVQAVSWHENHQIPLGGGSEADWKASYAGKVILHPITDVVVQPNETTAGWWLAIKVQVKAASAQPVKDVKISYTAGGRHGTTTFRFQFGNKC